MRLHSRNSAGTLPRHHRAGFGLIELLIATSILVTGMLLLLGVFPTSMDGVRQARDRLVATHLAQYYIDSECSKPYSSMVSGTYSNIMPAKVDGRSTEVSYTTVVSVSPTDLIASNKAELSIQVQWMHRGQLRHVSLGGARTRED